MGLYDGASGQGELASTAQVAKILRAPVVLVVDASSQSRSVAALVHGFASWDPQVRIGGVILNKVGSDRHEALLRDALEESGLPVLGVLRRAEQVAVPSRHLGLVPVAERRGDAVGAVGAMREQVVAGCDLDALMALARTAPALPGEVWDAVAAIGACGGPVPPPSSVGGRGPVVAVASGPAFTFSYAEHTELLTAAGAEVVPFDPLRDEALPPGTRGLVIGGGSRRCTPPSSPPTRRCARPSPRWRSPGPRCPPSVRGCCIWRVRSTGCRCAGSSMPRRGCRSG